MLDSSWFWVNVSCSAPLINTALTPSIIVKCDTPHICFTRTDNKWDRKTHLAARDIFTTLSSQHFFHIISIMYILFTFSRDFVFLNNTRSEVNYWFIGRSQQSVDQGNNFVYQTPPCQVRCLSAEDWRVGPITGVVMVSAHQEPPVTINSVAS